METTEQFASRLAALVPAAMISAGVSLGNELGLFDMMIDHGKPMTTEEIAAKGNWKER